MKQREGYKVVIIDEAQRRITENKCPACGKHKDHWTRRKDWRCCSYECTTKFTNEMIIYGWSDLRLKAFERDNFTCVKCGKRPVRWDNKNRPEPSALIGDHIIPIALGGKEWDINNVQTLCIACDKIKTKRDIGDIVRARAVEKHLRTGQRTL